jgi:hypothetical protein
MPGRAQLPIPRKLDLLGRTDTLTVGAKKALGNFINEYGPSKGVDIFFKKAEENGTPGLSLRRQVNETYHKGAKL